MLFQLNNSFVKESGDAEWDAWHAEMSKGDDGGGLTFEDLNPLITSKDTGTSAKDYFESVTPSYADQADENWGGTSGDWWDGATSKDPFQTMEDAQADAAAAKKKKKGAKKKSAAASYSAPSLAYTPAYTTPAASSASFPWLLVAGAGVAIYFLVIRKL